MASAQSRTTHASDIADECCQYLAGLMARVIGGQSYENARSELQEAEWGYPLMAVIENNHIINMINVRTVKDVASSHLDKVRM